MDGKNMYLPETVALREDITVALVKLKGYDISIADLGMLQAMFSDYESISSALRPYVAVAVSSGLISGYPDGTFRGQAGITRAEAATLLWRARQYGFDNKGTDPSTPITPPTTQQPTPTPTPTPTPEPTPAPTPTPDPSEPNPTDTPAASDKAYIVTTLVDANVTSGERNITSDDNDNLYYIDGGKIFMVNINSKNKTELIDTATLIIDDTVGGIYSAGFSSQNIFYSTTSNRLFLKGSFTRTDGSQPVKYAIYQINGTNAELVATAGTNGTAFNQGSNGTNMGHIVAELPNGDLLCTSNISSLFIRTKGSGYFPNKHVNDSYNDVKKDVRTGKDVYASEQGTSISTDYSTAKQIDGVVYVLEGNRNLTLFKMSEDYSSATMPWVGKEVIRLTNGVAGFGGNNLYTYSADDPYWAIYDLEGNVIKSFNAGDMDIKDLRPLSPAQHRLVITQNGSIVFYDGVTKQFRIISENK